VISPLLANVYLHYAFDLWAKRWREREATGDMIIVRYADDIITGFQYESDARRFRDAMRERLGEFALSLHPDKTRLIRVRPLRGGQSRAARVRQAGNLPFPGPNVHLRQVARRQVPDPQEEPTRPHAGQAQGHQAGVATAHASVDTRTGQVAGTRRARGLQLPRRADQHPSPRGFRHHLIDLWRCTLRRRSQKDKTTWARMARLAHDYLPKPTILHPWPSDRFAVRHPR